MGNKMFVFSVSRRQDVPAVWEMQAFAAKPLMWHSCRMN